MAKFKCSCGHVLDLIRSPAKEELMLVSLILLEDLGEKIAKKALSEDDFFDSLREDAREVLECPVCSRLWLQDNLGGFVSFVREG